MNYGELKTAIQNYVQTSEATFVAQIPDFIRTAEDRTYRSVQMPAFWKSTASGDIGADASYTLPVGAVEVYDVRVSKTLGQVTGEWTYLLKKDWDFLLEAYPGGAAADTGIPKYYAIGGADVSGSNPTMDIQVAPAPSGSTVQISVDYYGKTVSDSLTGGGDSGVTWLSVTFPDVLLYGSLADAYAFMKGEPG